MNRVLFVVMPFGGLRPAIGVSLLKGHLERMGIAAEILYANLGFARRIGTDDYRYISDHAPTDSLAGDWIFSTAAFGAREAADAAYVDEFVHRFGWSKHLPAETALGIVSGARDQAGSFVDDLLDTVAWGDYDLVGFSTTFAQNVASLALARRIKERHPEVTIAFGGANCEDLMGLQLHRSFPFIDFVFSGEADVSFPRLAAAMRDGGNVHGIPGVISRRDGESFYSDLTPERIANLDDLPYPDYDDFVAQVKAEFPDHNRPIKPLMETSRGCWWGQKNQCTFCGLNGGGMAFRSKSPQRVLDEIDTLQTRYGSSALEIVDNILDMKYFRDVLPALQRREKKVRLFYETKANLSKEQVGVLQAAGISRIQPGIESFSTTILKLMRKGVHGIQNVQLLKWCKEAGVQVSWNILCGFPGEDAADYVEMARVMDHLHHFDPPAFVGIIRLDRFSPNFERPEELGFTNVRADRSYPLVYDLGGDELENLAYYFEYDYVDRRDPAVYITPAQDAAERWRASTGNGGLEYDDNGDTLTVSDLRAEGPGAVTVLKGPARLVYLYCDENRSLRQIGEFLTEHGVATTPEAVVADLIASRIMLVMDGRYLSLATNRAGATAPAPLRPVTLAKA